MSESILVPALGESITEATVAKWLKNVGDNVEADEPIVELETDKVNLEVPSPIRGVLGSIEANDGSVVQVGSVLGSVSQNGSKAAEEKTVTKKISKISDKEKIPRKTEKIIEEAENENSKEISKFIEKKDEELSQIFSEKEPEKLNGSEETLVLTNEVKEDNKITDLSPAVRKIVNEKNIDITKIKGSGKNNQILKGDLINAMGEKPKPNERMIKYGPEEKIKMSKLRQTIAKRLKEAQNNAAMLTTFNEIDMTKIIEMRKENQEKFQEEYGIKLGFMSFFVKACIDGLKDYPVLNAETENNEIIYKNYYNISFAVGTDKGLVVPVLKKADELSFADIEKNIKKMSDKAKDGKLNIEDLQGGTFTISNGGVYGSMMSTPILNPPQSAVLGMHNITERPVIIDGEIKARPMMYLALSYDHRIIDGREAVSFLKSIKDNLEDPKKLFQKN
tara:strand:- start:459 stop:1802 length:1344 start_codon:yes stop_codon:yes gene_type:complete